MNKIIKLLLSGIVLVVCSTSLYPAAFSDKPVERPLIDGIKLFDYSAVVVPQVGVDCGLHSLKNSIALFNYFANVIDEQERNRQLKSEAIGAFQGMNVCRIEAGRPAGSLDPEEIATLALKLEDPFDIIQRDKLLILDNLSDIDLMRSDNQNKQLATVVEDIQAGNPFVHAFILGNMDQVGKKDGHWVAAVLRREGAGDALEIHTANSSGPDGIGFDIAMARQLIAFLNRLNPKELRFRIINELFNTLNNNVRNQLYDAVVKNIEAIVAEAHAQNVFNLSSFKAEELINILVDIDSTILLRENQQLKNDLLEQLLSRALVKDVQPSKQGFLREFDREVQEEAQRAQAEAAVRKQETLRRLQEEAQRRAQAESTVAAQTVRPPAPTLSRRARILEAERAFRAAQQRR